MRSRLKHDALQIKIYHPRHQLREMQQRLAELEERLQVRIDVRIEYERRHSMMAEERLKRVIGERTGRDAQRLALLSERLWGLSPLRKLASGYGFVTDSGGRRLASITQAPPGSMIGIQVTDGSLTARVLERQEAER